MVLLREKSASSRWRALQVRLKGTSPLPFTYPRTRPQNPNRGPAPLLGANFQDFPPLCVRHRNIIPADCPNHAHDPTMSSTFPSTVTHRSRNRLPAASDE